jgi:hypothetical protein
MSSLEIKQQLQLLNQQLADLESSIDDPIERNESKQQLNKQIKKLEKSLRNIEQFELEQQELELLQSELTLNHQSSASQSIILESQSENIISNSTPVAIDLKKSSTIEQSENQNSQQIEKPVAYYPPKPNHNTSNGLKDWQKTVISSSIIGLFILIGLIFLKSNYSFQSTTSSPTENQAQSSLSKTTTSPNSTSSSETSQQDNSSETEETIESLPEVINQPQEQNYDNSTASESEVIASNYNFPLDSCGDKNPGYANTWYPVYVDDTPENLNIIRGNYCRDAIRKYREKAQINSIQVASFTSEFKAREFAQLMQVNIGSGEVGEPTVYNFDENVNNYSSDNALINSDVDYYEFNESDSISLIVRLYDLLSQKNFPEAELLYSPQLAYQFNSNFFSQFERVTVENLRRVSKTTNSIDFIGQNTYIWFDGSIQKELRYYKVINLNGNLKITDSRFLKVTKFR